MYLIKRLEKWGHLACVIVVVSILTLLCSHIWCVCLFLFFIFLKKYKYNKKKCYIKGVSCVEFMNSQKLDTYLKYQWIWWDWVEFHLNNFKKLNQNIWVGVGWINLDLLVPTTRNLSMYLFLKKMEKYASYIW